MKSFIGLNIKYLYEENKLSQNEFGELFGLKKGVISTYVNGKTNPQVETIQKICKHFDISLDDFINKDLRKVQQIEPGHYYKDPLIAAMSQEPMGSMNSAPYVNIINDLRAANADKDKIIKMLEEEIKRLRGNQDEAYNGKTA